MNIKLNHDECKAFIEKEELVRVAREAAKQLEVLVNGQGRGSDFLGWISLPQEIAGDSKKIKQTAERLRAQAKITVVIGIGGSYLGAKSITDALGNPFDNTQHQVIFAGQHLGEDYHSRLLNYLAGKTFNIIVISKSGTTTEPAIAFRLIKSLLEKNLGRKESIKHIVAITDNKSGALRKLADNEGYETFPIPSDVGGRYSVFSAVGLLPVACAGFDTDQLINGADAMAKETLDNISPDNPALLYASLRNILYNKGYYIELLASYDPELQYTTEWWKQLFGESEGKEGKGIFPASAVMTSDLHSLGQYIQEGRRFIFETVISSDGPETSLIIPDDSINLDKLNYLAGKRISDVNQKAMEGTIMAHNDGGVPVIRINIPSINEYNLGQLLYFFEISCAVSGYLLGVNPFDQPGVEAYKRNMFRLLGKEGY